MKTTLRLYNKFPNSFYTTEFRLKETLSIEYNNFKNKEPVIQPFSRYNYPD